MKRTTALTSTMMKRRSRLPIVSSFRCNSTNASSKPRKLKPNPWLTQAPAPSRSEWEHLSTAMLGAWEALELSKLAAPSLELVALAVVGVLPTAWPQVPVASLALPPQRRAQALLSAVQLSVRIARPLEAWVPWVVWALLAELAQLACSPLAELPSLEVSGALEDSKREPRLEAERQLVTIHMPTSRST